MKMRDVAATRRPGVLLTGAAKIIELVTPMLDVIRKSWGWTGLEPREVVAVNPFGNAIVRAVDGAFWRISPEELSCEVIASDADGYAALLLEDTFQTDWRMDRLVQIASAKFGLLPSGRCYCLKLPAVLGGRYDADNLGTISVEELIAFSGYVAEQIKDLPDGAKVTFELRP
jgi:hypothetical protein